MALTNEEKRKINEEEEYRAQIREREISKSSLNDQNTQKKKRGGFRLLFLLGLLFGIPFVWVTISEPSGNIDNTSEQSAPDKSDLVGNVNFDGAMFTVTNQELKDWDSCWATLNSEYRYPSNAPLSRFSDLKAGQTVQISSRDFTLKNGERFNPFAVKPKGFSLQCGSRFGYWSWE